MIKLTKEFWTQAYQTNIGKLIGICYRYTGNHPLSEDLAHDAFLKAIEKSQSFRGDGNFDAWLRRIVVNHTLQYLRNQKKIPYLQQLTTDQAEAISAQENDSPIQMMEFTATELLETIGGLPEHHRLVFNLYVLEKFTHAQIGDELGISEGTSKSHLARARKKLQQLLTEKVEIQKENKERAAVILFTLADDTSMDQLFFERFEKFSLPPKNPLSLNFLQHPGTDHFTKIFSKRSFRIISASSAVMVVTLVILFISKRAGNHEGNKLNNNTTVSTLADKDTIAREKNIENTSPQAATISRDSVNTGRNIKLKSMKPLDSLALLLALSSGTINASSLKDSIKNQLQVPALEIVPASIDSSLNRNQLKSAVIPKIDSARRGTFRATALYWNKDNMEVDFKGVVRVDFKDQHFQGTGSFNILGKVHLLIVDGQQVDLGKTIKLSDQDYYLTVLDSTEANSKYGDLGNNGAILIDRIK